MPKFFIFFNFFTAKVRFLVENLANHFAQTKNILKMKQSIINKMQDFFPAYPVEKAWIFGSYARGEETCKSDIDVMVRFDKNAQISLLDLVGIKLDLENKVHKKVDLIKEGQLRRWAQESAESENLVQDNLI